MLKILKKIIVLGFVLFTVNLLLFGLAKVLFPSRSILPGFVEFVSQHKNQSIDYLFIGSSRTYTAMNLETINSHLSLAPEQLKILGISGISFPPLYFITKKVIEQTKPNQHIFVELSSINEYFEYHPKFLLEEPYTLQKENFSVSYLLKNFSKRFETGFNWFAKIKTISFYWNPSGFYSMEEIAERALGMKEGNIEMLRSSMKELDQYNPLKLKHQKKYINETKELNIYVSLLLEMARKKQIDLVFYPPNRLSEQEYDTILPVFLQIPNENKINPNQNPKFKALMGKAYLWDRGHFNEKGAKIYAGIVGEIIAKRDSISVKKITE